MGLALRIWRVLAAGAAETIRESKEHCTVRRPRRFMLGG
jgi:hypothetical protein